MNTLKISHIFKNLDFYKQNYLNILADTAQYHQQVEDAYIDLWPLPQKKLWLGELLQLWFAQKWVVDSSTQLFDAEPVLTRHLSSAQDLYIYQLKGNSVLGTNQARVWSVSQQAHSTVQLDSAIKYYAIYKAL